VITPLVPANDEAGWLRQVVVMGAIEAATNPRHEPGVDSSHDARRSYLVRRRTANEPFPFEPLLNLETSSVERRDWDFRPGPLFNHVLIVDEINRATPRAQSALLEAMAEGHTTVDGSQHDLPEPFLVLATQNPFGDAGTFPLIAGEYDRFAVSVSLGLPGRDVERELLRGNGGLGALDALEAVTDPSELSRCQREVAAMHVASAVEEYVLDIAEATRIGGPSMPGDRGISPRATQALLAVAKGCAATVGRSYVTPDDVQTVASAVLAHRMQGDTTSGLSAASAAVAEMLTSVAAEHLNGGV
jgi:MoxR-like ATPase